MTYIRESVKMSQQFAFFFSIAQTHTHSAKRKFKGAKEIIFAKVWQLTYTLFNFVIEL